MNRPEIEFVPFPKMARLRRQVVITEKIDGTNALVHISDDGQVYAGSRTRWITPEDDNFGFARWVDEHRDELRGLGAGNHFGEWWGQGIQRRYGLTEKRFSLFNTARWNETTPPPACCHVVPVLISAILDDTCIAHALRILGQYGSQAAPGFMKPEGIVVYHTALSTYMKVTLDGDGVPKGKLQGDG